MCPILSFVSSLNTFGSMKRTQNLESWLEEGIVGGHVLVLKGEKKFLNDRPRQLPKRRIHTAGSCTSLPVSPFAQLDGLRILTEDVVVSHHNNVQCRCHNRSFLDGGNSTINSGNLRECALCHTK